MKPSLACVWVLLCVSLPAYAQTKSSQDKTTGATRVVSTAEITKIDAKKKSLQVKELAQPSGAPGNGQGGRRGGGQGGRRQGGGGGRGGGIGFPGGGRTGGGGGRYPGGNGGGTVTNQVKEYKVFVTKDTTMQFAGATIDFTDFHVGDRIAFSGIPKGSKGDLDATAITRQ